MISRLALAAALGLTLSSAAAAESYLNPDRAWWARYLAIVDGATPDFERMAKADPAYAAADEFTRAEVLANLVAALQAQHAEIDVEDAEITVTIRAKLGEYSSEQGGFPVSLFAPNIHLPLDTNSLFFRNSATYTTFKATPEKGKVLRARIGTQTIAADVTVTNVAKLTTRLRSYDAFVSKVVYTLDDGLVIGEFTDAEQAPPSAAAAADSVTRVRDRIVELMAIPPLGTSWIDAKAIIQTAYPLSASDDFAYTDRGKQIAYDVQNGTVVMDAAHEADKSFLVYLQQAEGAWRTTSGFSYDPNAGDSISVKGTGPGLACYTPATLDRCAVLEFSASGVGHSLTRAYGVIEWERSGTPQDMLTGFLADDVAVFDVLSAPVAYDAASVKAGDVPRFIDGRSVKAYIAGAGELVEGVPLYDPLANTSGVNPVMREIGLFALDGADGRVPLAFVLQ